MTKQQVIEKFCELNSKVAKVIVPNDNCDCFCGENPLSFDIGFQFPKEVMDFIVTSVELQLEEEEKQIKKIIEFYISEDNVK